MFCKTKLSAALQTLRFQRLCSTALALWLSMLVSQVVAATWSLSQNKLAHMNKDTFHMLILTVGNGLNMSTTQCHHTTHLMYKSLCLG
jgi:hypothetical protein